MRKLDGLTAIVTGAAGGIGRGIGRRLAQEGANVALVDKNEVMLCETKLIIDKDCGNASIHQGDITIADDIKRILSTVTKETGQVDILVNNAGIADEAVFLDIKTENWERIIRVNLTGTFLFTQCAAKEMLHSGGGSIINIASIDGRAADGPFASYVASKAGILGLTKAAATELAPFNIRVNSVSPGWVKTPMVESSVRPITLAHMQNDFCRVPMKRLVEINEIAATVVFLASPDASGITGSEVTVDCGTTANLYILETLPTEE